MVIKFDTDNKKELIAAYEMLLILMKLTIKGQITLFTPEDGYKVHKKESYENR